jgi:hypothetical protein
MPASGTRPLEPCALLSGNPDRVWGIESIGDGKLVAGKGDNEDTSMSSTLTDCLAVR